MQATQSGTALGVVGVRVVRDAQGTWVDLDRTAFRRVRRPATRFGCVAEGVQR